MTDGYGKRGQGVAGDIGAEEGAGNDAEGGGGEVSGRVDLSLLLPRFEQGLGLLLHDGFEADDGLTVEGRLQMLAALLPLFAVRGQQTLVGDVAQKAGTASLLVVVGSVLFENVIGIVRVVENIDRMRS